MKNLGSMLLVALMVIALVSISLARAGPRENAFTDQTVVSVHVPPIVASVPPMTVGFDVIQNLSPAYPRLASVNQYIADTSVETGLSTTVAKRSINATANATARSAPRIVLLV